MKDNRIFTENNTNRVYTAQALKRELLADCKRLSPAQQDKLEEFEKIKTRDKYIQVMLDGIDTLVTLSPQTLTRLLYLSTYIQYNSGLLVVDNQTLTKGQVCHLLHINHTTAGNFLDELTQAGVLSVNADGCHISKDYIRYGKAGKRGLVRVYASAYCSLYENTLAAKHVYIGYILCLMPLIDTRSNIVCGKLQERTGALQRATAHTVPLLFKEVCKAAGYNPSNLNKLLNEISQLVIFYNGNIEPLVIFVRPESRSPPTEWNLIINPHFFYAGSDVDRIELEADFQTYHNRR